MRNLHTFTLLSLLHLVASDTSDNIADNGVYHINATGEWTFPAPQYSNQDNPSEWTARVALTTTDFMDYDYRSTTWLDTPYDVPVNGSSITRDVCLFMQLPVIRKMGMIDYDLGGNGCVDALGADCAGNLTRYLAEQYQMRTSEDGTMDCITVNNTDHFRQDIYDFCPEIFEAGGSGFKFSRLIPSDHDLGSALHGNESAYWAAIAQTPSDASSEEKYDEVSEYVFTYFIISGPEYENPTEMPTVEAVCVKPEMVLEGSRDLPSAASGVTAARSMLSLTIFLILATGWLL